MRFENQVAIVTGGGSGIGKATCLRFAREGAAVAVLDMNLAAAEEVAGSIRAAGGKALAVKADISNADEVKAAVQAVVDAFGQVDVLVNNAGWDRLMPFVETEPAFWDKVIGINLRGPIAVTHAVLPHMIARGKGAIVNMASDAGRVGSTGETVYAAAKGGVIAFSKSVAREVARQGIRCNCIAPGLTETPMLQAQRDHNEKVIAAITRGIPLGRAGDPDELARAILFMASDDAQYVTGQVLSVNGGLTMV